MTVQPDTKVLAALEQACREEFTGSSLWQYVTCDQGAVVHHGGLTPRVAYVLQLPDAHVRRRLQAMVDAGLALRQQWRPGAPIRWWPVGLFARLTDGAEKAPAA